METNSTTSPLLDQVKEFLGELEATQTELLELYSQKRSALRKAQSAELLKIAHSEETLTKRLRSLVIHRQEILQLAARQGSTAKTLTEFVADTAGQEGAALSARIERSRRRSAELRFETGIHWITLIRAFHHHTELLELIAHHGRRAATYSRGPSQETAGGVILDASI